jgi:hypothetical protein
VLWSQVSGDLRCRGISCPDDHLRQRQLGHDLGLAQVRAQASKLEMENALGMQDAENGVIL